MAITSSSFGRFKRGSGPVMGGMRMVTPKVTANLLKSVDAINKNLVAINKLLSQQAGIKAAQQQKQQEETSRKAENLRRFNIESALEAPKKIAGFITNAIARPAKSIFNTIKQFLDPFIKFFTLTFIGWFTNGLIKWFQQNKETKQQQLKQFIPKIMTALTIAGGVLLAIQVGIPIILGTLSAIVTTLPILMGALLNPATWITLLVVGSGILLFEGIEALGERIDPGLRARERVIRTATQGKPSIFSPTGGLKYEQGEQYQKPGSQATTDFRQYLDIGDGKFIRAEQIQELQNRYFDKFTVYKKKGPGAFERVGEETISPETLSANKNANVQRLGVYQKANKIAEHFRSYVKDRDAANAAKNAYNIQKANYEKQLAYYSSGKMTQDEIDKAVGPLKARMLEDKRRFEETQAKLSRTTNTMKTLYDRTTDEQRNYLSSQLGITKDKIYNPDTLESGQADYTASRIGGMLNSMISNNEFVRTMNSSINSLRTNVSQIVDSGVDFIANIQIKPDYQEDGGNDPVSLGPPTAISPFNIEDPFLQYSKKMYNAWGVI